jgi:type IV pilus assembly protein PilM
MAKSGAVWGIEIGQYALKALKLQYAESAERVVAVSFDYVPYPKILSQPDAIPDELIPQALETFLSRNDVQGSQIAMSVPGHTALVRFIQLPPVESSKVAEIVKYEARQQIPFALEEVIWDYQPLGSGIVEGGYMLDAEVGLFAMKRDQVMQHLRPFNNAKLEVELIQIAPLALYNVLAYDEMGIRPGEPAQGGEEFVIVLDMGCDNTTLLVSSGAKIWVRNVPIGGNHFTRALTKEMKLSFAKAEHLKCNATKSPDPRAVFQALRPVFNDYVSEIQRSIGYFSSVNRQAKISKVIGYGNGFKLAGLQKFLQQNLQYEVERPDTFKGLTGESVLNAPLFQENLLGFAVPYGLALQCLEQTRIRTSLLPPEIAMSRKIRRKKPWAVVSAAALLSGVALSMIGNGITYGTVHTKPWDDAVAEADSLASQLGTWAGNYTTEQGTFDSTRTEARNLVIGRRDFTWLELYKTINECLPRETGDDQDVTDIEQRQRLSVSHITCQHLGDLNEWFSKVPELHRTYLSDRDKASPPSGEGYVFTLNGMHYHHTEKIEEQGLPYVINSLLRPKLQQWTITTEDGNTIDVGRMGISHALAWQVSHTLIPYYPNGPATAAVAGVQGADGRRIAIGGPTAPGRFGGGFGGGMGFGQGPLGGQSGLAPPVAAPGVVDPNDDSVRRIWETRFVVQFAWKPTPAEARLASPDDVPTSTEAAEGEVSAEAAAY